jgi:hypothetical protein
MGFIGWVPGGQDGEMRLGVTLRLRAIDLPETKRTIDHEPARSGAIAVSLVGDLTDHGRDEGGGQVFDMLDRLRPVHLSPTQVARLAELWKRWHLNDMRPGCAHQSATWSCTNHDESVANGWDVVKSLFGEYPYPMRGDTCHVCGRSRWAEPTDYCMKAEPPYRYGSAWLYEPVPLAVVEELKVLADYKET